MEKRTNLKTVLLISIVLPAAMQLNTWADGTYSGGTGEPNDPYLIATAADMNEIGVHPNDWNDCFLLTADINLIDYNETNFNIIGNDSNSFTGIFDGNNHTISNFTWKSANTDFVGLFGCVDDPNAEIKDVRLIDPNVQGYDDVGALVGVLGDGEITGCRVEGGAVSGHWNIGGMVGHNDERSDISNCYATSHVTGADWWAGGLAGFNYGSISNSYSTGPVSGNNGVGGLTGYNHGTVSKCYAIGSVMGTYDRVGGLIGCNYGDISKCHATGSVNGNEHVGGLSGDNWGGHISNCYAEGLVVGTDENTGGLVGWNDEGTISNCYASGSVTGNYNYVGGLVGCNSNGTVSNCYATGSVAGTSDYVGGLVGANYNGYITICYVTGSVSGDNRVGGLAGFNNGTILNCYAIGDVSGNSNFGGLVGRNYYADGIFASFWDVNTTGQDNGIGYNEGTGTVEVYGRTTAQMQTESTFTDYCWDFVGETINGPNDIWTIHEDQDYPRLVWDLVNFLGWYEVDFADYAFFAQRWLDDNCGASNDCDGTDLDFSDEVDTCDLQIFTNYWLQGF